VNISPKIIVGAVLCLIALVVILGSYDTNDNDKISVLQTPWGGMSVHAEAGPFLTFWGSVTEYNKVEAISLDGVSVRFSDTNQGDATGVARYRLPLDEKRMLKINQEFGSPDALRSNLLTRVTNETAKASARLMTVEVHYSGGAGELSNEFEEQLRDGIYVTEQIVSKATTYKNSEGDETLDKLARVQVIKTKNDDGTYRRKTSALTEYGLLVIQASIEDVDYADNVDDRLVRQKEAAAAQALARENLKRAQQEAQTAAAEGERQVAVTKAEESVKTERQVAESERQKQMALIAAAQRKEVAKEDLEKQKLALEIQRKEAEGLKVLAAARAEASKTNSGVDPKYVFDRKLEAQVAIQTQWALAYSKRPVPTVSMSNGNEGDTNELQDLMKANYALELANKIR
jgi:regulator of protease activity HflC (stomatin/prohibitin superfamily)